MHDAARADDIEHLKGFLDFPYPDDVRKVCAELPGPAFFPGGSGVIGSDGQARRMLPRHGVMVLAHNFGTVKYFDGLPPCGGENLAVGTWGNLLPFLRECGIAVESCFFTNALMGLMHADSNTKADLPGHQDAAFRAGCHRVFHAALYRQHPRLLLALGKPAIRFVGEAFPDQLGAWRAIEKKGYELVDDNASGGPVRSDVAFPNGGGSLTVVALLHPSFRRQNIGRRHFRQKRGDDCEHAMVAEGLKLSQSAP